MKITLFTKIFPLLALVVGLLMTVPTQAVSAQGAAECTQADNCTVVSDMQSGDFTATHTITKVTIQAGNTIIHHNPEDGDYDNGCYLLNFSESTGEDSHPNDTVHWERYATPGPDCQEISHLDIWHWVAPTAITLSGVDINSGSDFNFIAMLLIIGFCTFGGAVLIWLWKRFIWPSLSKVKFVQGALDGFHRRFD